MEVNKNIYKIVFVVCFCTTVTFGQSVYSITLETALRTELFSSYSTQQRPNKQVLVFADLTLLTVNDMNIKDQTLSVSAQLGLSWLDERLKWDTGRTQDYSSINYMFSTERYTWKPTIYVENSVEDLSVITDLNTPMRMNQKGLIEWSTSAIYMVSCEAVITYYPLDQQICDIKLSTTGYTSLQIHLLLKADPVDLLFYSENGEWELLAVTGTKPDDRVKGSVSHSKVTFSIHLQRRPMFHVLNTMFPVVLMAFLIPMAFKLHVESGEKIGYCLTVLLAYAVYLSMISENIPSTSVSICYLSIYLASTLVLSTLSVLFVILVINVHHTPDDEPMSDRLRSVALKMEKCICRRKRNESATQPVKVAPATEELPKGKKHGAFLESCDPEEEEMTWVRLSRLLDRFFFLSFMIIISASTIIFIFLISFQMITS